MREITDRKELRRSPQKAAQPNTLDDARALVIVVVLVPIVFGVPAMVIFVPPLVLRIPAVLALRREFAAPVSGFLAVRAMLCNCDMQITVNLDGFALASVIRTNWR